MPEILKPFTPCNNRPARRALLQEDAKAGLIILWTYITLLI